VARFIAKLMFDGKRSLAERIIYDAFDTIEARQKRAPLDVFEQALKNATPTLEVKPRRVGGSTYQVPVDIRRERGNTLAMRSMVSKSMMQLSSVSRRSISTSQALRANPPPRCLGRCRCRN